ncbi:MAG: hypothetical protein LBK25_01020 [Treponema sp.]|jgi:hypothetical protein|nr:hypothetical protein [Treponema sp.]
MLYQTKVNITNRSQSVYMSRRRGAGGDWVRGLGAGVRHRWRARESREQSEGVAWVSGRGGVRHRRRARESREQSEGVARVSGMAVSNALVSDIGGVRAVSDTAGVAGAGVAQA